MTTEEFFNKVLPSHPMGELGMLAEAIRYSEEHRQEWIEECERNDRKHMADWN